MLRQLFCRALVVASFVAVTTIAQAQIPDVADDDIERAGDLLVALDAADLEDDITIWPNLADESIGDFNLVELGNPLFEEVGGAPAITLNSGPDLDAYQSPEPAPEGLVGPNPTRSIEVWVHNLVVVGEETLVAWAHRGGPAGTNMSFNYADNPSWGAVGHWGAGHDPCHPRGKDPR